MNTGTEAFPKWVRVYSTVCPWTHTSGDFTANWDDLTDPVLIREGVEES